MINYAKKLENTFDDIIDYSRNVLLLKNKEYSNNKDPLSNFKQSAEIAGISVQQSWIISFNKGINSIFRYIRDVDSKPFKKIVHGNKEYVNEDIKMRICDAINYLVFLYYMIEEEEEKQKLLANKDEVKFINE